MKKRIILATLILNFAIASSAAVAQDSRISELTVEKISSNAARVSGAENAVYSRSGKFLAIQSASEFLLLPAGKPIESFSESGSARRRNGRIIGFLSTDTLVYSAGGEIFALDAVTQKSRKLFSRSGGQRLADKVLSQREFVIVSDDLIITGDGQYDMGGNPGNIYRYDLKNRRVKKGAPIKQFWEAALSPSGKYILYERGGEQSNYVDYYDVRQDKNHEAARRFNFRKAFPQFSETSASPLIWVGSRDAFLAYVTSGVHPDDIKPEDEEKHNKTWLCLLDATGGRILWKKLVERDAFQSQFQPLSAGKVLVNYGEDVYELSLADGRESRIRGIGGKSMVLSPDKKKITFIKSNRIFTALVNGGSEKPVLDLPPDWKPATNYKGMGERPPMWSPTGERLIVFGENQLLIARL
jgi:hypothetical protein